MRELSANEAIGAATLWMREGIRASTKTAAGCGGLWEGGWSIATILASARLFGAACGSRLAAAASVARGRTIGPSPRHGLLTNGFLCLLHIPTNLSESPSSRYAIFFKTAVMLTAAIAPRPISKSGSTIA